MKIAFWKKESGNLMMAKQGITEEQLNDIQKLKVGDRLILWLNEKPKDTYPDYNLRVYQPKVK